MTEMFQQKKDSVQQRWSMAVKGMLSAYCPHWLISWQLICHQPSCYYQCIGLSSLECLASSKGIDFSFTGCFRQSFRGQIWPSSHYFSITVLWPNDKVTDHLEMQY